MKQSQPPASDDSQKAKTSFYFNKELQKKLKIISTKEDKKLTDVMEEAAKEYISKYEKVHGEIKL